MSLDTGMVEGDVWNVPLSKAGLVTRGTIALDVRPPLEYLFDRAVDTTSPLDGTFGSEIAQGIGSP